MTDPARRPRRLEHIPTVGFRDALIFPGLAFPIRRSGRSLAEVDYSSPDCLCFVTCCEERCRRRRVQDAPRSSEPCWSMEQRVGILNAFVTTLREAEARLDVACVMPDHVHAVLAPGGQGLTVQQLVGRMKGRASAAERRSGRASLRWQEGCWDHVLRPSERAEDALAAICQYVRENPVKAGLVARWQEYPAIYPAP